MSNTVPEGWRESSIGEITSKDSLFCDGDWVESKDQDQAGSNRLIQLADVGDGVFVNKSSRFMNDEQFDRLKCTALKKNDILIARMPDPLGRACLYPLESGRAATVVDVAVIRTPNADHYWLMSAINSSEFRYQIDLNASGTTRTRIARGTLSQIKVLEPPLPEQQKIAAILSSVDDVIEKTRAQIDKLKDLKTGMMQELLTKGIGSGGVPHTEFKDSPVGRIPSSWACLELSDYISIGRGFAFKSEDYRESGRAILRVTNIARNGEIDLSSNVMHIDPNEAKKYKSYELRQGDILIVMVGATVGKLAAVPAHCENYLLNQNMWRLVVKDFQLYDQTFAYYALSPVVERFLSRQQGSARGFLTQKDFSQELIAMPPIHEQIIISGMISSVDAKLRSKRAINSQLNNLKKALMQDLLTGKVRVNVDQKESAVS